MKFITIFSAAAVTFLSTFASLAADGRPICTEELSYDYWWNYGWSNVPGDRGLDLLKKAYEIRSECEPYPQ